MKREVEQLRHKSKEQEEKVAKAQREHHADMDVKQVMETKCRNLEEKLAEYAAELSAHKEELQNTRREYKELCEDHIAMQAGQAQQLQQDIARAQQQLQKMAGPGFDPDKAAKIIERIEKSQAQLAELGGDQQSLDMGAPRKLSDPGAEARKFDTERTKRTLEERQDLLQQQRMLPDEEPDLFAEQQLETAEERLLQQYNYDQKLGFVPSMLERASAQAEPAVAAPEGVVFVAFEHGTLPVIWASGNPDLTPESEEPQYSRVMQFNASADFCGTAKVSVTDKCMEISQRGVRSTAGDGVTSSTPVASAINSPASVTALNKP